MNVYGTRILNENVTVYFDGAYYVFMSKIYGTIALAVRDNFFSSETQSMFTLYYGNKDFVSSGDAERVRVDVEKFISEKECQYVKVYVGFFEFKEDCNRRFGVRLCVEDRRT